MAFYGRTQQQQQSPFFQVYCCCCCKHRLFFFPFFNHALCVRNTTHYWLHACHCDMGSFILTRLPYRREYTDLTVTFDCIFSISINFARSSHVRANEKRIFLIFIDSEMNHWFTSATETTAFNQLFSTLYLPPKERNNCLVQLIEKQSKEISERKEEKVAI